MLMIADAGVILQTAHEAAEAQGMRMPLTLGGKGSATIGGLVSTNAGGTQVLRHGTMRALTAGLEVVLANGDRLDMMSPLPKDNQGPDPKQLFIGAEGVFGIVTRVAVRLSPAIAERAVAWAAVDSPHAALAVLRRLEPLLGNAIEGFELVPDDALAHVVDHIPGARRPVEADTPWHVLIECVASDTSSGIAQRLEDALGTLLADGAISDAVIAANDTQADAFWMLRDGISEAEKAIGPALQHDVSVPVERMPDFIARVPGRVAAQLSGATSLAFGHLGDGNVHFHVRPPIGTDAHRWIEDEGREASRIVYAAAIEMGGSISAEHGIGRVKREEFAEFGDPVRIAMLRAMKGAMDPAGLLNPGVLIP
jgi:FAD/FMN-containing dehydrogenase